MTGQAKNDDLWPHQSRAVREAHGFFNGGGQRLLVVCPTGGGKSRIGQRWKPDVVFVHTNELLRETRLKFPHAHCLTIQGKKFPPGKRVLLDEAHHYKAAQWGAVWEHYRDSLVLGLTATPERGDGQALDNFQGLIVAAQYSELIRGGFIVPCQAIHPGEPIDGGLSMDPVDAYFAHGANMRGFIFCGSIQQAEDVAERLRARSSRAAAVGSHQKKLSSHRLDAFRAGELDIITCVDMINEGIDIPAAQLAILACTIGTQGGYLQRVGRVLRAYPGKRVARMVDLSGAVFAHGLPTQDRKYSLSGMGIERSDAQTVCSCPKCGACYLPKPKCPRCGFVAPIKHREVKIKKTAMIEAVANRDTKTCLELLLKERSAKGRQWYWVVAKYREWFDSAPDLSHVAENEKDAEFKRLESEAAERGYKRGYAYARWNEIFGAR